MAKYYYDLSLPVKQTPHQVVTLGRQILIRLLNWNYIILLLFLQRFVIFTHIEVIKHGINKSNENIHKKEEGSYYVVSANKASSVTL